MVVKMLCKRVAHYDKHEIDEFAHVLKSEGIENILALRGDPNPNACAKDDFKHS